MRTCIVLISLAMGKLKLKVRGEKLPNMDLFSKSDPYLCVYISRNNEEDFHFINRTEVKKDDLNPQWEELLLEHEDINQNNLKAKIKLEVFSFKRLLLLSWPFLFKIRIYFQNYKI